MKPSATIKSEMHGSRKFAYFVLVGSVGFSVDASVLSMLHIWWDTNLYAARAVSFGAAVAVTWTLNRKLTFASHDESSLRGGAYLRYLAVQISGALINMGVFAMVIGLSPTARRWPVMPLAIGSLVAMMFTFTLSCGWVFKPSRAH